MNSMSFQPVWPFCDRSFANNGHFEAYVELRDTEQSEWRYAPYIDIRNSIAGPRVRPCLTIHLRSLLMLQVLGYHSCISRPTEMRD